MPLRCLQQLHVQLQLPQLPQLRHRRVVLSIAQMTNVADKCGHTKGELCALRACPQANGFDVAVQVALLLFIQFAQRTSMRSGSVVLAVLKHPKVCLMFPLQPQRQRKTAMNVSFLNQTPRCIPFCARRDIDSTTLKVAGKHGSAAFATKSFMRRE